MRQFTTVDVRDLNSKFLRIYVDRADLVECQPDWMKRGLQQTATGYGRKLNSGLKIHYNGKLYRLYVTIFSNIGSTWFTSMGVKIYVD